MIDPCATSEERLALLRYADELSPEERREVLEHLEGCEACRRARDEVEATAASLDVVPLVYPDSARYGALKERVLGAVAAGAGPCPREADLLWRDELGDDEGVELAEHLEGCAACRESLRSFSGVGAALDAVPVPPHPDLGGPLKERVLAEVAARPARGGLVLRLPWGPVRAAAAALLVAVGLGVGYASFQAGGAAPGPQLGAVSAAQLAAIKRGADELARSGDFRAAAESYRMVIEQGDADPALRGLVDDSRRELRMLAAIGEAGDLDVERKVRVLGEIVSSNPDSHAAGAVAADLRIVIDGYRLEAATDEHFREPHQIKVGAGPRFVDRDAVYRQVSPELLTALNTPLRQVSLIQEAIRLESNPGEQPGVRIQSLTDARRHYLDAIELDPSTPAGRRAAERLDALEVRLEDLERAG